MSISTELKDYLISEGASDVGFFKCEGGPLPYGITVVLRLSPEIVREIDGKPTLTYFNHYRQVNAYIDRLLLQAGLYLQKKGYGYITVAASQSMNEEGWNFKGRFSHKEGACLAGLGGIGRNSLFYHKEWGSLVRLGTVFTDCPLETGERIPLDICGSCRKCVDACPAGAIKFTEFHYGIEREDIFDPQACSEHMKKAYQKIGRGAVCGICMRVCPKNKLDKKEG
ncbi:MAG: epoxyqueuosine reductase [Clostridia bacterium]|nr:epoxyqueuosine reductase [Clostridia bacterium]